MGVALGDDIKEILTDVGAAFNIVQITTSPYSGEVAGGYCLIRPALQSSRPLVRELVTEAQFAFDTAVVNGDIINVPVIPQKYLVLTKAPRVFENAIFANPSMLYKVNFSGEWQRFSGEASGYDSNYISNTIPVAMQNPIYGTIADFDILLSFEELSKVGEISREDHVLFVPSVYGVREQDRIMTVSGEMYYKVLGVTEARFAGVAVCRIKEDYRK
jgi:hypothetical protein